MRALAIVCLGIALLLSLAASGLAQSGSGYDLTWSSIDGGGATYAAGGGYTLGATIGQSDAGGLSGGNFTLQGGFWPGTLFPYGIYLPLIKR